MTDNFDLIKEFIKSEWNNEFDLCTDIFYTIEIVWRSKDNTNIKSHKFKTYYIKTMDDLDKYEYEIKLLCDTLQMRAYISVNHKSMRQIALNTVSEYANRLAQGNLDKAYSIFDSCAAKYVERSEQLWIVDVDKEDADARNISIDDLTLYYVAAIEECDPRKPIVDVIPTRSGAHLITHPFNTTEFTNKTHRTNLECLIKKNNNTLLYENIN